MESSSERQIGVREQFAFHLIERKAEDLKKVCSRCGNVKQFCNECQQQYLFYRGVHIANLPVAKAEICATRELDDVEVREYDLAEDEERGTLQLYKEILEPYIAHEAQVQTQGLSLFFIGTNHLGKTTAAVHMALKLMARGLQVHYITFPQLHRLHTRSFDEIEVGSLLDVIQNVDFLIVDELGKETVKSESVRYLADTYLKVREENLKPTVIISNKPKKVLWGDIKGGGYGPSFVSMLLERYRLFRFNPGGQNLRLKYRVKWPI